MKGVRIGLIVPSNDIVLETELPRFLSSHPQVGFSFHSSRIRLTGLSPAHLSAARVQQVRSILELGDAKPHMILHGCFAAMVATGPEEYRYTESLIAEQLATGGSEALVRSTVGALVGAIQAVGAQRIMLLTGHAGPVDEALIACLEAAAFEVAAVKRLTLPEQLAAGDHLGSRLLSDAQALLRTAGGPIDAGVVSLPSLPLDSGFLDAAECELGIPMISPASASAHSILLAAQLPLTLGTGGSLLRGESMGKFRIAGTVTDS